MTEVVRDVIKGVKNYKQDVYEKFDKEIEEISKLREDVSNQIVPYSEQVKRLALSGPGSEAPKMVADMNKEFTQDELTFIQNQQLPLPANVFWQTLNEPDYAEIPDKVGKISLDLGQKKVHLSTTKTANKKKATKLQNIPENESNNGESPSDSEKEGRTKKKEEVASENGSEAEGTQESDNDTDNDSQETESSSRCLFTLFAIGF